MSAADRREELEAIIWRGRRLDHATVIAVLAAADRYAEAVADERIAGRVTDRTRAAAMSPDERLAAAAADVAAHYRRAS